MAKMKFDGMPKAPKKAKRPSAPKMPMMEAEGQGQSKMPMAYAEGGLVKVKGAGAALRGAKYRC